MDINNNSNKFLYPRGSELRKWDLHIHTKSDDNYTYDPDLQISQKERNDQEYPKIFIEHIYGIDNLGAIAITDHNTSEWVDKFITYLIIGIIPHSSLYYMRKLKYITLYLYSKSK